MELDGDRHVLGSIGVTACPHSSARSIGAPFSNVWASTGDAGDGSALLQLRQQRQSAWGGGGIVVRGLAARCDDGPRIAVPAPQGGAGGGGWALGISVSSEPSPAAFNGDRGRVLVYEPMGGAGMHAPPPPLEEQPPHCQWGSAADHASGGGGGGGGEGLASPTSALAPQRQQRYETHDLDHLAPPALHSAAQHPRSVDRAPSMEGRSADRGEGSSGGGGLGGGVSGGYGAGAGADASTGGRGMFPPFPSNVSATRAASSKLPHAQRVRRIKSYAKGTAPVRVTKARRDTHAEVPTSYQQPMSHQWSTPARRVPTHPQRDAAAAATAAAAIPLQSLWPPPSTHHTSGLGHTDAEMVEEAHAVRAWHAPPSHQGRRRSLLGFSEGVRGPLLVFRDNHSVAAPAAAAAAAAAAAIEMAGVNAATASATAAAATSAALLKRHCTGGSLGHSCGAGTGAEGRIRLDARATDTTTAEALSVRPHLLLALAVPTLAVQK